MTREPAGTTRAAAGTNPTATATTRAPSGTTRAALAQLAAGPDKAANLTAAAALVAEAGAAGARLVVLPEYAMAHLERPDAAGLAAVAEPLDGQFVTALADLARAHRLTLLAGMVEDLADGGRPANTVVAVGPDGALLGAYRKVHLYDAFGDRESDRLRAGPPEPLVLAVDGLRVGVLTCYDLRFPEMARLLLDAGAEVLAVPAAWVAGPGKADHWLTLAKARAIENTAYVLGCGMTGPRCTGRSVVVDPAGAILADAGEDPGVVVADLDPAVLAEVRAANPSLRNRRFTVRPR
ncbi:carbon-nitrogen hydrolase family protein [Georgenia sp. TF02-10]|uniref:carbon-nitrogen hydrolase family protein n=1 Tax=Georgenia sp. TF02-10 TaxID=2917725 RepID=UPI001FA78CDF|nr:carbon-nitrogen hydrolase family protein [Georgenia sp. TF02-10]UNX55656.1 carbon-nitrogen hydrolase family protein [Georgenia sp. TF02-10]